MLRAGITVRFGVSGENDNGKRVIDFCGERGLCRKYLLQAQECALVHHDGNEHDRSGAGEERYAALCASCEGSDRNRASPCTSPCCVKSSWWVHGLREER